jgi:hypothetical protein
MEIDFSEIQVAINQILNIKSLVRKKKKTQVEKKKELFVMIINSIEQVINRQNLLYAEINLDLTKYDEAFLDIIDALVMLHFNKEGAELISYYLYERLTPDGDINPLVDPDNNEVYLETAEDLWNLLTLIDTNVKE